MQSKIIGTTMPVLEIALYPGETIIAEAGQLSWMSSGIQMHTTTATAGSTSFWGAVTRAVSGGGLFMTEFTSPSMAAMVAFAAKVPGAIVALQVTPGRGYFVHRHGFLCATQGVELSTGFQRSLGAGLFGGEGFILQKLVGSCHAWVELGGEIVTYDLRPGETLQVHPGHVGMFEDTVTFDITMIPGIRNKLFGGDGFFLGHLTGPGKIWLQTLTMPNLAHAIAPYLSQTASNSVETTVAEVGLAGTILKNMFNSR